MYTNVSIGDKLITIKKTHLLDVDDIVKVINVNKEMGIIHFEPDSDSDSSKCGIVSFGKYEEFFEKLTEEAPKVTEERIEEILEEAEIETYTVFDKCTIVACKLPNGFVIVESSACVSPENFDESLGFEICLEKIENKIWELEGYKLQEELYRQAMAENHPNDCDDCVFNNREEEESLQHSRNGCDECNYCREYNCPNNTMS